MEQEFVLPDAFARDRVGSRMTQNYISIPKGSNVRTAMKELIAGAAKTENISVLYVLDIHWRLVGVIDLKDLIRARADAPLEKIIATAYPKAYGEDLIEDFLEAQGETSQDVIPVLDGQERLLGVLTARELAQMAEDALEDDYAKLGGLSAEEDLREPLGKSLSKRLPWLMILFALGMLVSGVVGLFDRVVEHLSVIVSFQSLILGMAGNVGTQSLAVTIRALSEDALTRAEKRYLIFKEARVGLCNGVVLGSLSFVLVGCYLFLVKGEAIRFAFSVSLCTGLSLLSAMLLSGIFGTLIPILFKSLKIDPAVASGPFITTVNDLVAVVAYYGLAWGLLVA